MLRYAVAGALAVVALGLVLESWARGFLPGDPDHVAGRMRNVISLGGLSAALALASMLPLGAVVRATLRDLTHVWRGDLSWPQALRAGRRPRPHPERPRRAEKVRAAGRRGPRRRPGRPPRRG